MHKFNQWEKTKIALSTTICVTTVQRESLHNLTTSDSLRTKRGVLWDGEDMMRSTGQESHQCRSNLGAQMVDGDLTAAGLWLESFQFRLPPLLLVFEGNQNAGPLYCFITGRLALQGHHILYNLVNYSY